MSERDDGRVTIKPKDNPKIEFTFKKTAVRGRQALLLLKPQPNGIGRTWLFVSKRQGNIEGLISDLKEKTVEELFNYIQSSTHESVKNINKRLSEEDKKFNKEYSDVVKKGKIVLSHDESGKTTVKFGFLNQELKDLSEEDVDNIRKICIRFNKNVGITQRYNDYLIDVGIEDSSLQDETLDENTKESWEDFEKKVANGINKGIKNFLFKVSKEKEYNQENFAFNIGGSYQSDIIVTTNQNFDENAAKKDNFKPDENDFFVEVKKNYESAQYLRFDFTFSDEKFHAVNPPNDELAKILTTAVQVEGGCVTDKFIELRDKIKNCISLLKDITKTNENFSSSVKLDDEDIDIDSFPRAFEPLARAFNFFIIDWTKKFVALRQKYVYEFFKDKKENKNIIITAKRLNEKLTTFGKDKQFQNMDALVKFKKMYRMLVSTDKSINREDEYNSTLFTISSLDGQKETIKFKEKIIEYIQNYYIGKYAKYIQIGDDLYYFKVAKNNDPFGIMGKILEFNSKNLEINLKITLKTALQLHLELQLEKNQPNNKSEMSFIDGKFDIEPDSLFYNLLIR